MKKLLIVLSLFTAITSSLAGDSGIIGNPLSSFKQQTINTCWTHTAFHYIESIVQKETGMSVYLSQDKHYWFYIFRERLLARYRNHAPLIGNLDDENLFQDMGFTAEALNVFFKYGVRFFALSENADRMVSAGLKNVKAVDEGENGHKSLKFKDFSQILSLPTETHALALIDSTLASKGFTPYPSDEFQVRGKTYSMTEWKNTISKIKILDPEDHLVWINITSKKKAKIPEKYFLVPTIMSFSVLNEAVTSEVADQIVLESLKEGAPVPESSNAHTTLILAASKDRYYVADSKESKIKMAFKGFSEGSAIHVRASLVNRFFNIQKVGNFLEQVIITGH